MLSPQALRLIGLLTPEPVEVSTQELGNPALRELVRLGIVKVEWVQGKDYTHTIRLDRSRAQHLRPSVYN